MPASAPTTAGSTHLPSRLLDHTSFRLCSWVQVWGVAVALYLVGTVVWNLFATGERVFE